MNLKTSVQFSSVLQLCPTLCTPMDCSMPGLPVHHQLLEFFQTMSFELVMSEDFTGYYTQKKFFSKECFTDDAMF